MRAYAAPPSPPKSWFLSSGTATSVISASWPRRWGRSLDTSEIAGALAAIEPDLDNFRAAVDWSVESGQFDAGAELLGALGRFSLSWGFGRRLWPAAKRC